GMSVLGIDCSGFTYTIYERHGLILPRDADEQYMCGEEIDISDLQRGDLLFFGAPERVTHVGMYIGEGRFIHAASRRGVSVTTLRESASQRNCLGARRILP
ncbi:C40 family peptidase, partial [bacterium]|nr:C40 family peptidase [bacterium]